MKLKMNNKGSATITVVVTMFMLIALGSALLFGAYTAYRIALAQRADAKNFYTAENAMDDIRSGVQRAVSDALGKAYTDTLTEYAKNSDPAYDPQSAFAAKFNDALEENTFYNDSQYDTGALAGFVARPEGAAMSLGSSGDYSAATGAVTKTVEDGILTGITLEQLSLHWVRDGYETNITTDIQISVPAFSGSLGSCAVVAQQGIEQNGPGSLNGIVYSGEDIEVKSDELNGQRGSLALSGAAYVGDDLLLSGNDCEVSIDGEYYGFGSDAKNAGDSSAIIVNGRNTKLDLSGLDKLSLAGFSFVDVTGISDTVPEGSEALGGRNQVLMGQSMAFKANQLAYLAPVECISNYASNPFVLTKEVTGEGGAAQEVFTAPVVDLSAVSLDGKRLSEYGSAKTLYRNIAGMETPIGYVFLKFDTAEKANDYFKAYFEAYPQRIEQYMDFYLTALNTMDAHTEVTAAGNVFTITSAEGKDTLGIIEGEGSITSMHHSFSDYVSTGALNSLEGTLTYTMSGKRAIVTSGDFTADEAVCSDTCLIISAGNVTVSGSFSGAVLAAGKVTLRSGASVSAAALPAGMLSAVTEGSDAKLSDFLKAGFGEREASNGNDWAAEKLVVYKNWAKN